MIFITDQKGREIIMGFIHKHEYGFYDNVQFYLRETVSLSSVFDVFCSSLHADLIKYDDEHSLVYLNS